MPKSKYFTIPASLDLSVGVDSHCDDHESTPEKLIVQTTYILSKYGKGNFCCWWVFFSKRNLSKDFIVLQKDRKTCGRAVPCVRSPHTNLVLPTKSLS